MDYSQSYLLAQSLIQCPSITPHDRGILNIIQTSLENTGFHCIRKKFCGDGSYPVNNLYARFGKKGRNFCFSGHTDVVPPGDETAWKFHPFSGTIHNGYLFGRGAVDMKSAIACFIIAASAFINTYTNFNESISLLITGDEESDAINGTKKLIQWCHKKGESFNLCLIGEPTNPNCLGEMMKIGRRGSITIWLTILGIQGHVAYPHLADNPIKRMITLLNILSKYIFDNGNKYFQPTNLEILSLDTENNITNMIPAKSSTVFNIRFNNEYSGKLLDRSIRNICKKYAGSYQIKTKIYSEPFLSEPGKLTTLISNASKKIVNKSPILSTIGGTSDARFIYKYCEVAEFGLIGESMHKVNEHVKIKDLIQLTKIYKEILYNFFINNN